MISHSKNDASMESNKIYPMAVLHVRKQTADHEVTCDEAGRIFVTIEESDMAAIITEFVNQNAYKLFEICKDNGCSRT